jgi:hypothetical protein
VQGFSISGNVFLRRTDFFRIKSLALAAFMLEFLEVRKGLDGKSSKC